MRIVLILFVLMCTFFNPVFLSAQGKSEAAGNETIISKAEDISRQEAEALNNELDAEVQKTNAEVEKIRVKAEEEMLKDIEQAAKDLGMSIQEYQKEKFPDEIEEKKPPEEQ